MRIVHNPPARTGLLLPQRALSVHTQEPFIKLRINDRFPNALVRNCDSANSGPALSAENPARPIRSLNFAQRRLGTSCVNRIYFGEFLRYSPRRHGNKVPAMSACSLYAAFRMATWRSFRITLSSFIDYSTGERSTRSSDLQDVHAEGSIVSERFDVL